MAHLMREVFPISGMGLFSGVRSSVAFGSAAPGAGLNVVRGAVSARIPVSIGSVTTDTSWSGLPAGVPIRNTTLAGKDAAGRPCIAATVEHVVSALAGLGVWDAMIILVAVECPILDGSAAPFVDALMPVSDASSPPSPTAVPLVLTRRIEVRDERSGANITAEPLVRGERPMYTYELDYGPASPVPPHSASWDLSAAAYAKEVAPARTFSLHHEVEAARKAGMFAHLSPKDLLVIGPDGQPVDNRWRFPDPACISTEPARHKLLDLIGDLALLGRPLHARVVATKSGHALTHQFCRAVERAMAAETGGGPAT